MTLRQHGRSIHGLSRPCWLSACRICSACGHCDDEHVRGLRRGAAAELSGLDRGLDERIEVALQHEGVGADRGPRPRAARPRRPADRRPHRRFGSGRPAGGGRRRGEVEPEVYACAAKMRPKRARQIFTANTRHAPIANRRKNRALIDLPSASSPQGRSFQDRSGNR